MERGLAMNLEQLKDYIDNHKSIPVTEELKEKTIKAALNSGIDIEDKKDNKFLKLIKSKNINRIVAIAASFAVTLSVVLYAVFFGFKKPQSNYDSETSGISGDTKDVDNGHGTEGSTPETLNDVSEVTPGEITNPATQNLTKQNEAKQTRQTEHKGAATTRIIPGTDKSGTGKFTENPFVRTIDNNISTFSIDVDTASYVMFRRDIARMSLQDFQRMGNFIRTEEAINYFKYNYAKPTGDKPIAVTTAVGDCSWNPKAKLAFITIAGKELDLAKQNGSNIVFLIDVSGSMADDDKLPLLKKSFANAVENLSAKDVVSIVTYSSSVNTVLAGAKGSEKSRILSAINSLNASGGTAGADGLNRAYSVAQDYFIKGGNNRIILATDGDFNIGPSSVKEMKNLVIKKRESGIFLTVLGFGVNNIQSGDERLEVLADNGNGGYYVIDCLEEGEKVLNQQFSSVLYTVAKDVKIQVEFNKSTVDSYRLIGYENRMLSNEDFSNDKVDGGDLGSGQTVTALYEIISKNSGEGELFKVKVRYKNPDSDVSQLYEHSGKISQNLTSDFYFASAVAEACLVINNSKYKGNASLSHAYEIACEYGITSADKSRLEFINILKKLIS